MTARRALLSALLVLAGVALTGCPSADLGRNHVTAFCERDEAESAGPNRQRTVTTKKGVSFTHDF